MRRAEKFACACTSLDRWSRRRDSYSLPPFIARKLLIVGSSRTAKNARNATVRYDSVTAHVLRTASSNRDCRTAVQLA